LEKDKFYVKLQGDYREWEIVRRVNKKKVLLQCDNRFTYIDYNDLIKLEILQEVKGIREGTAKKIYTFVVQRESLFLTLSAVGAVILASVAQIIRSGPFFFIFAYLTISIFTLFVLIIIRKIKL
jgi:hypothetical protein